MLLCLIGAGIASGQSAKNNTLSAKEAADGWLLLFDGDAAFGLRGEKVEARDGKLMLRGGVLAAGTRFGDYELRFDFHEDAGQVGAELNVGDSKIQLTRHPSFDPKTKPWTRVTARVSKGKATLSHGAPDEDQGRAGKQDVNGSGPIAWSVDAGSVLYLKNVKLRPLGLQSIFNGKDLTGWKVFPGRKSKFQVTGDGAINVKDGPGDLQTEGKYADFVLQLECISNGKHLNSGVFFRCRPDEYQNGYEAQIRNQFTAEPTQEYVLEDYDPATHALTGKRKVKSAAVDFGTGAIYRRQPARKEVAKDGEWFTLTIVADKNHFATWVNGIQVADWTDHRPPSDNARTGYRRDAGHISLQGHDPTTDLSFRGFRIAELGK